MSSKKTNILLEHHKMIEKSVKWCEKETEKTFAELEKLEKNKGENYELKKEILEGQLLYLIDKIKFEGREATRFQKMTEKTSLAAKLRKKLK